MESRQNRTVSFAPGTQQDVVYFFHMNGCPHCIAMQAAWGQLVGSKIPSVRLEKVEASEIASKLDKNTQRKLGTDSIDGYPEIRMLKKNGEMVIYSGDRSFAHLKGWVEQNRSNPSVEISRVVTPGRGKRGGTRRQKRRRPGCKRSGKRRGRGTRFTRRPHRRSRVR